MNTRQLHVLNRLFETFEGKLTRQKYIRLVGKQPVPGTQQRQPISEDTALRDLDGLVASGMLIRKGAGRGVYYRIPLPAETDASQFDADLFKVTDRE